MYLYLCILIYSKYSSHTLDDGTHIQWITNSIGPNTERVLRTLKTLAEVYETGVANDIVVIPPSALNIQVAGSHYKHRKIQPIEYCEANRLGACESAIIKYITRWREKGGMKDLEKLKHYVDLLIETEQKYHKWNPQNNTWNHEGDSQNYD